ncbi:MAG: hypothetical protein IJX19_13285 [Clostridia bacterium]|nr:hypothetical protein [Clostridia bacterium]
MNRLKQYAHSPMLPLYLLWVAMIVAHFIFPTDLADDTWFAQILAGDKLSFENWSRFLYERYQLWSSRLAIEGLLILMTRLPILWRLLDTLISIAISILLFRLVNPERSLTKNILLCALWLIYPFHLTWEAGFIATTLNYTWPLAAALLAITPLVKQFQGREVKAWEYIVAFPALLFACFQELVCATLLLTLLGSIFYRVFFEKKIPLFQIGCVAVCVGMLIFALTCPGNDNRTLLETASWFPEYAEFSLFQKVEIGFSSMMKVMFLKPNFFVLAFCAVLAVAVWVNIGSWRGAIPAAFPFLYGFLRGVCRLGADTVGENGTGFVLSKPLTWFPVLIFVLLLALILISMRIAMDDTKQYCLSFFLLFLGAASRMAMGLSPTVWASGNRSCIFLYLTMAVVMGMMILGIMQKLAEKRKKKQ